MSEILLTISEVGARVRLAKPTIYKLMNRGLFPRPIRVGAARVFWPESDIEDYLASRPRAGVTHDLR